MLAFTSYYWINDREWISRKKIEIGAKHCRHNLKQEIRREWCALELKDITGGPETCGGGWGTSLQRQVGAKPGQALQMLWGVRSLSRISGKPFIEGHRARWKGWTKLSLAALLKLSWGRKTGNGDVGGSNKIKNVKKAHFNLQNAM